MKLGPSKLSDIMLGNAGLLFSCPFRQIDIIFFKKMTDSADWQVIFVKNVFRPIVL